MINNKSIKHNEVLILDNARIHNGGEAKTIEDLLWNAEIDGIPLQVLVVYLPTRSPELNPIELLFNILSRRIKSYWYQIGTSDNKAVVKLSAKIMDEMSFDLIYKTMNHCGYFS